MKKEPDMPLIIFATILIPVVVLCVVFSYAGYSNNKYRESARSAVGSDECIDYNIPPENLSHDEKIDYILTHRITNGHCPPRTPSSVIRAVAELLKEESQCTE